MTKTPDRRAGTFERLQGALSWPSGCAAERNGLAIWGSITLHNQDEVAASMGLPGLTGHALVLAAWGRWGEDCVERLVGDFAFALYDPQRRTLYCVRDALGVRPLLYHCSKRRFTFGSHPGDLAMARDVSCHVDLARVAAHLAGQAGDRDSTFISGIRRLLPGHVLSVTPDRIRLRCYWRADRERELRLASDGEYEDAFRELFLRAVRSHTSDQKDVGSLLSGGLDSSSITCAARLSVPAPLKTYSAIFKAVPSVDERRFIDRVLEQGGMSPLFLDASAIGPLANVETLTLALGQPVAAPNLFIHDALYASAKADGVNAMLDGFDGDTTVSHGLAFLTELAGTGRLLRLLTEARGVSRHFGASVPRILWSRGIRPFLPVGTRWRNSIDRSAPTFIVRDLLNHLTSRADAIARRERHEHARKIGSVAVAATMETLHYTAARHGIEPRFPFFDRRLVEFCLSLPGDQKIRGGWTRSILRRALKGILPAEIAARPGKAEAGVNFVRGLGLFDQARFSGLLFDCPTLHQYVDRSALLATYARFKAHPTPSDALGLWRAATLSAWIEAK